MTVTDVLEYLAGGVTEAEILSDFPDLTAEDIKACLAFAADRDRKVSSRALERPSGRAHKACGAGESIKPGA